MTLIARFGKLSTLIGAMLLFSLMLITFIDVAGRQIWNAPLLGAVELTEIGLSLMTFLLLPIVCIQQEHISVDLIDSVAGRFLNTIRNILTSVIGATVFGIISWRMWILGDRALSYNDATISLQIPLAPLFYGLAVLSAVVVLVFVYLLLRPRERQESAEMESARRLSEIGE